MMSLALGEGAEVKIVTDGPDEEQAMTGMEDYLSNSGAK